MTAPSYILTPQTYNHTAISVYWRASGTDWYAIPATDNTIVPPDPTVWSAAESQIRGEVGAALADQKARPKLAFTAYDYAPGGATDPRLIDAITGIATAGVTLSTVTTNEIPVQSDLFLVDLLFVFESRVRGGTRTELTASAVHLTPADVSPANTGYTRAWTGVVYGPLTRVSS